QAPAPFCARVAPGTKTLNATAKVSRSMVELRLVRFIVGSHEWLIRFVSLSSGRASRCARQGLVSRRNVVDALAPGNFQKRAIFMPSMRSSQNQRSADSSGDRP